MSPRHSERSSTEGMRQLATSAITDGRDTRDGDAELARRPRVSRPTAIVLSFVASYAAHVAIPSAFARRGPRVGWVGGRPARLNRLGLLPVAAGAVGLAWCYRAHYAPGETVAVTLIPEHLLATGPYRLSRNPMYVSEQAMWWGWSWFFGSPIVAGCALLFGAGMRHAVRREEKTLESRFGDDWRDYSRQVPRWL